MKRIYAYFNDRDLYGIISLLTKLGIKFYNCAQKQVINLPSIVSEISPYFLMLDTDHYIGYTPCFYSSRYIQCGMFYLEKETGEKITTIFAVLHKYIKQNFILSQDKSYYVGEMMYKEWFEKKVCLPHFVKYRKLIVQQAIISPLLQIAKSEGFTVARNNVRLRNVRGFDINDTSLVIFYDADHTIYTILNHSILRYEPESECIFVEKSKQKEEYSLILDERLAANTSSNIVKLFEKLVDASGDKGHRADSPVPALTE